MSWAFNPRTGTDQFNTRLPRRLTPARIPLPLQNGHKGGSGHPPPPRPIRLPSLLRAKVHDHHGPTRKESCVSIVPDTALGCKTAFNPNSLKDDDLAGRLGLQLKELTKLVTVLDKAGLVKTYVHPSQDHRIHQTHPTQAPPERAQRRCTAFSRPTVLLHRLPALLQCRQVACGGNAKDHRYRPTKCTFPWISPFRVQMC